jgi:hypothetical protein
VDDFVTLISTTGESFAIVGDPYDGGGFLGWSSIRIGDLNGDRFDEIVVSAIYANTIYVIYGKREFIQKNVLLNPLLPPSDGFRIIGRPEEINFGVSLTLLHDFRKGSRADLAITAQKLSAGQNIIYVLFGGVLFKKKNQNDIAIQQIVNNSTFCFKIIAPPFSYAGFSLAGIGDINSDGYDDLAIGSVPYSRGAFTTQKTFIIYGRSNNNNNNNNNNNELQLSQIKPEDGFTITGAGFIVTGIGDVNDDSINDMMITSYYDWQGRSCAYLIASPTNMTYSPSLQPSSRPTFVTNSPSLFANTSNNNTLIDFNSSFAFNATELPTFRPTRLPSLFPTVEPTIEPTRLNLAVGTSRPSQGKPSLAPSLTPTSGYHRLRGFSPTLSPSLMPTIVNTTDYSELDCSKSGDYHGRNETNYKFAITASSGMVSITGNDDGKARNLYVLYCPTKKEEDRLDVIIQNFRLSTDMISLTHVVSEAGKLLHSVNEIPYSLKSGSLTLFFCSESRLQVTLLSHSSFDLSENNFLFLLPSYNGMKDQRRKHSLKTERIQMGIALGVFALFGWILYITKSTEEAESNDNYSLKGEVVDLQEHQDKNHIDGSNNNTNEELPSFSSSSSFSDLLREWERQSSSLHDDNDNSNNSESDLLLPSDSNSLIPSTIGTNTDDGNGNDQEEEDAKEKKDDLESHFIEQLFRIFDLSEDEEDEDEGEKLELEDDELELTIDLENDDDLDGSSESL